MKEVSVHFDLPTINNCRDLKGIPTKDNKIIKPNMLIRSGNLSNASAADREILAEIPVTDIVDFRTSWEQRSMPNMPVPGSIYHYLPMFDESKMGAISKAEDMAKEMGQNPGAVMEAVYTTCLSEPYSQNQWKKFFDILLGSKGAVLFHCTQGKDRTGLGALLIENALGVDEGTIFDDYMQTNLYMNPEENVESKAVEKALNAETPPMDEGMNPFLFVYPEYYETAMKTIKDGWGSVDEYLEKALGIDAEMKQKLRDKYLEEK